MDTNDNSGTYTFEPEILTKLPTDPIITQQNPKQKRTIRPRVLKQDYDLLQHRYRLVKWVAIIGWILFAIALGSK